MNVLLELKWRISDTSCRDIYHCSLCRVLWELGIRRTGCEDGEWNWLVSVDGMTVDLFTVQ